MNQYRIYGRVLMIGLVLGFLLNNLAMSMNIPWAVIVCVPFMVIAGFWIYDWNTDIEIYQAPIAPKVFMVGEISHMTEISKMTSNSNSKEISLNKEDDPP